MSLAFSPPTHPLWFRVWHDGFSEDHAYRLIAAADYSESAAGRLWFVADFGGLWAVDMRRCLCLGYRAHAAGALRRALTEAEKGMRLPEAPPKSDFQ